jgi:hypothetical protein
VVAATALAACARPPASAPTTTAADLAATPGESTPAPREATGAPEADRSENADAGQLVCKTSGIFGTSELFLEWNGTAAKGLLRRVAPSGMAYRQRVQAERANGMIVVDDAGETDLAVHAAVVRQVDGKQHMRLGDGPGAWSACQ